MKRKIIETAKGYAEEDGSKLYIYTYGVANYDGMIDTFTNEERIDYLTGLYQCWSSFRYDAFYIDKYKGNRAEAVKEANRILGGEANEA